MNMLAASRSAIAACGGVPRRAITHVARLGAVASPSKTVITIQAGRIQAPRRLVAIRSATEAAAPAAPAPAAASAPSPAAVAASPDAPVSSLDVRVGVILKAEKHPDADALYISQIDVGEAEPRTIVSGLVEFVPIEAMQNRKVVVLCNLKPRNMRGTKSNGMVLCASNAAHDAVEPLAVPDAAAVGERVWFGEGNEQQPAAAEPNRVQKKKIWEAVQPGLKTDDSGVAGFLGRAMLTSAGQITCGMPSASIS